MQRIEDYWWGPKPAAAMLLLPIAGLGLALAHPVLGRPVTAQAVATQGISTRGPIYSIDLPYEEPHLPPGPNRELFTAVCRLCHSPRLVFTQPRFTEKKWSEVVHKMVASYGAPIPPDQEKDIVTYLTAVHGSSAAASKSPPK